MVSEAILVPSNNSHHELRFVVHMSFITFCQLAYRTIHRGISSIARGGSQCDCMVFQHAVQMAPFPPLKSLSGN